MKKFTLLFGLALLWGGTNVVAFGATPEESGEDAPKANTREWIVAEIAKANVKADAVAEAQQVYNVAQANYNSWAGRDTLEFKTTPIKSYENYADIYTELFNYSNDETLEVYVGTTGKSTRPVLVYAEKSVYEKIIAEGLFSINWLFVDPETKQKPVIITAKAYTKDENITNEMVSKSVGLRYCYINEEGKVAQTENISIPSDVNNDLGEVYVATWKQAASVMPATMQSPDATVIPAYTTAKNAYINAQKQLETAQKNLSHTITLTDNVISFNETIDELPSNVTLDGKGYGINSSSALFEVNKGVIRNLANPDGLITVDNEGTVRYCLEKTTPTTYRTYVSNTNYKDQQNVSLAEIIYGSNGFLFGYDVKNGIIQPSTPLYQAYYASAANKTLYSFYVNVVDAKPAFNTTAFKNATKVDAANMYKNAILYIDANVDVTGNNIAVKSNGAYTCANVVLTEETEFYIPMNVNATAFSYDRTFKAGYSSVCLPFVMPLSNDLKAYQFSNIDEKEGTMWFRRYTTVAANTPYLVNVATESAPFAKLDSVELVATPAQLLTEIGEVDFCGVYKKSMVSDLIQNSDYAVYGILGGKLVKASSDPENSDWLNPFRSYVYCKDITEAAGAPSYKIGLLEDDDTETGIETVATDGAETIGVKGGENAVEVTTDKACKVNVYSMNGMLVMSENVEAGTTVLPVKAGMYVVNGVKVIVK